MANVTTFNPNDKNSAIVLSNNNLTASLVNITGCVKATVAKKIGKWYWEIKVNSGSLLMIGAVYQNLVASTASYSSVGSIYWYMGSGGKYLSGTTTAYASVFAINDVIGIALDMENGTITYYKNGVSMGVITTDIISSSIANGGMIPAITTGSSSGGGAVTANFGATPFVYSLPTGYLAYNASDAISLLKGSDNNVYTFLTNNLVNLGSITPTQSDFQTNGMDDLSLALNAIKTLPQPVKLLSFSLFSRQLEVTQNVSVKQNAKFLISNNDKTTWYTFKDNAWAVVSLDSIASTGMTKVELQAITSAQWQNWFVRGRLDFAIYLNGYSGTGFTPPVVKNITVNFPSNQAPIISTPQATPNNTHNNSVRVTANLIDREGENVSYQVFVGSEQIYPFSAGVWTTPVDSGFALDFTVSNSYFKTGDNTLMLKVKDERGQISTWSTNVMITNINPIATIIHNNFSLQATIGDEDGDTVGYKVSINGVKKFPEDKEYTDLASQPSYFEYRWTSRDLNFGQLNTITVEVIDRFNGKTSYSFQVMGTYQGLIFTDENNDYFSTDIGEILKRLDFGTLVAGQRSGEKVIKVMNYNDFPVNNLTIKSVASQFPQHTGLWFSKALSPFTDDEMLTYLNTLQSGEEVQFYVRVKTDVFATSGCVFEILTKAEAV
jgi:hypothetical protein